MSVSWDYYDKFDKLNEKYLPTKGEGETKATQIVTAVNKLVYKWYNDGDVFDTTHHLKGWWNDLSSYANWLYEHTETAADILCKIEVCETDGDYEDLLQELTDKLFDEDYLQEQDKIAKVDTIYECDGIYKFIEETDDEDDYYDYDEEYNEDEDEDE